VFLQHPLDHTTEHEVAPTKGLTLHQAAIPYEEDDRMLGAGRAEGHHLERAVTAPRDAQSRLCVGGLGVADDGDLPVLGNGIAERLEPLFEADWGYLADAVQAARAAP
jgi:hypothetical protein